MHKQTRKAARPCPSPRALTVELPEPLRRSLAACAAHAGQSPEKYTLAAVLARIRCDVEYIRDDAMADAPGIEEGAL